MVTKAMASGVSACLATPFKIHGVNYSIAPRVRLPHTVSVTQSSRSNWANRTSCLLAAAKLLGRWRQN
ncbi:hypothetical protein ACVXG9_23085 [Escherichia coli]